MYPWHPTLFYPAMRMKVTPQNSTAMQRHNMTSLDPRPWKPLLCREM